jgi:hypothetical protein
MQQTPDEAEHTENRKADDILTALLIYSLLDSAQKSGREVNRMHVTCPQDHRSPSVSDNEA